MIGLKLSTKNRLRVHKLKSCADICKQNCGKYILYSFSQCVQNKWVKVMVSGQRASWKYEKATETIFDFLSQRTQRWKVASEMKLKNIYLLKILWPLKRKAKNMSQYYPHYFRVDKQIKILTISKMRYLPKVKYFWKLEVLTDPMTHHRVSSDYSKGLKNGLKVRSKHKNKGFTNNIR